MWAQEALLQTLDTTVKDRVLPMAGAALWAGDVLPGRRAGTVLDLRASSHRKLSKLLQARPVFVAATEAMPWRSGLKLDAAGSGIVVPVQFEALRLQYHTLKLQLSSHILRGRCCTAPIICTPPQMAHALQIQCCLSSFQLHASRSGY